MKVTEAEQYPILHFREPFDEIASEIWRKGWYSGVTVELEDGSHYSVFFYDSGRLAQDLQTDIASGGSCVAEPGMIVIPEISRTSMRRAIEQLHKEGWFKGLQPIDRSSERRTSGAKSRTYDTLAAQLRSVLEGEGDFIANAANFASLLFHSLPDLNWAGLYLYSDGELVLGPFQGQPACVRIAMGKGVCGTAAERRETVLVDNVHEFPGHIACDSASNSEIVVPLVKADRLIGVLDLDSPSFTRFDEEDAAGLNELAAIFVAAVR